MIITFETYNLIDFDLQLYKPKSILIEKIGSFTSITIDGKAYQFFQKKGTEDFCLINFNYKNLLISKKYESAFYIGMQVFQKE